MTRVRGARGLLALPALWLACGGEPEAPEAGAAAEAVPIGGRYEVKGVTVSLESGHQREIAGIIIIAETEGGYSSTFNLTTTYPGADQALPAEVIGRGEGTVDGRSLEGTAETQLVMATVPNVDPNFAFIPRMVSTRIASTTRATIAADGSVTIQIENRPAEGEDYAPTRTTLHGARVSAAGIGGGAATAERR